jgi:hypothetical protein
MIDTHQHVFWHGRNDADLVADMDAFGIRLNSPAENMLQYGHS